jgi:CheY-like chemotaxis protein
MQKTILIAEDFDDTRHLMKLILESYEYKVVEASDGNQAVEMFNIHKPDLILMDLAMPQMDGLTATETIRTIENGAGIPIIAVSAFSEHFYDKAIEAGCNDIIEKPVDFNKLISMVDESFH